MALNIFRNYSKLSQLFLKVSFQKYRQNKAIDKCTITFKKFTPQQFQTLL